MIITNYQQNYQWCDCNTQKDGYYISWQHLVNLYESDKGKGSGLSLVPKLKFEHIYKLSSFSKMRVDLAAQVRMMMC